MNCIRLTHANLKVPMYVAVVQIAGMYESPGHKCTHVVATGGAIFPATETPEQIQALMRDTAPGQPGSDTKSDLTPKKE